MSPLLQVALGGALGAVLRFTTVTQLSRMTGAGFPWGTLLVNLLGCFLMGALYGAFGARVPAAPLLMAGVLGGFTTYSAFSLDAWLLFERGAVWPALAYVCATALGSILLCALGVLSGRSIAI